MTLQTCNWKDSCLHLTTGLSVKKQAVPDLVFQILKNRKGFMLMWCDFSLLSILKRLMIVVFSLEVQVALISLWYTMTKLTLSTM